jgi:hypothetical protein
MATFNYDAARRAGYSDQQITSFVRQQAQSGNNLKLSRSEASIKPNFFERVAGFLGMKEFGQGLGQAAATKTGEAKAATASSALESQGAERLIKTALAKPIGDPGRTRLLREAQSILGGQSAQAGQAATDLVSNKQFLGSAAQTALNVVGVGIPAKGKLATDVARFSGLGAAMGAAEGVRQEDTAPLDMLKRVGTGALIGAIFPTLSAARRGIGKLTQKTGEKITTSVIRPSNADISDGFSVRNVTKYDLGGTLKQTLAKTTEQMNGLSDDLNKILTAAPDAKPVDLQEVYKKTAEKLLSSDRKLANFGNTKGIKKVLTDLSDELNELFPDDKQVNLFDATQIKRGAGAKGAWVYGSADPDANAVQKVFTTFYRELRKSIESSSPESLKGINRKLSELIPVQNAVIRRIPIAERNNLLGLTDSIGLFASVFDPRSLLVVGGKMLTTSGRVGNVLTKIGQKLQALPEAALNKGLRQIGRTATIGATQRIGEE